MVQLYNLFSGETDTLNKVIMELILSYFSHLISQNICIMKLLVKKRQSEMQCSELHRAP